MGIYSFLNNWDPCVKDSALTDVGNGTLNHISGDGTVCNICMVKNIVEVKKGGEIPVPPPGGQVSAGTAEITVPCDTMALFNFSGGISFTSINEQTNPPHGVHTGGGNIVVNGVSIPGSIGTGGVETIFQEDLTIGLVTRAGEKDFSGTRMIPLTAGLNTLEVTLITSAQIISRSTGQPLGDWRFNYTYATWTVTGPDLLSLNCT